MQFKFYASQKTLAGKRLKAEVEKAVSANQVEYFDTIEQFGEGLNCPSWSGPAAVLMAASKEELRELHAIGPKLGSMRLALVLPDRSDETFLQGCMLLPECLSHSDSDFRDVAMFLEKFNQPEKDQRPMESHTSSPAALTAVV